MKPRQLIVGMLAAAGLSISAANATVTPILWDFGLTGAADTNNPCLSGCASLAQFSVPKGLEIDASGFTTTMGKSVDLFRKEAGGVETGLGLVDDPSGEHEITPLGFVQLNLSDLHSPPLLDLTLSFTPDSVQKGDKWALFLSNTLGSHGGIPVDSSTIQTTVEVNTAGFKFLDVGALSGNVLLKAIDAKVSTPEPATLALLGVGLVGLGIARRQRKRR